MTSADFVFLSARVLLAGVLGVAAVAKLLDLPGSRRAFLDFGGPRSLAGPASYLLPLVELAIALALLPRSTATYGAWAAGVLFVIFVLVVSINLARGRKPNCHCFGKLRSTPVGWRTLVRNGALIAVSAFVALRAPDNPGPSLVSWLLPVSLPQGLAGAVGIALLLAQGVMLIKLARENRALRKRVAESSALPHAGTAPPAASALRAAQSARGRAVGSSAPSFELKNIDGSIVTLNGLLTAAKPVVLVFSDPDCAPCRRLLPEIEAWQTDGKSLTTAVISRGTADVNKAKLDGHHLRYVLLQRKREVADAYGAIGTPSAVVVRPDGTIGSALAGGDAEIRQLVADWTRAAPAEPPPLVLAPSFVLPDLDGRQIGLNEYAGKATLVLFWNPRCGFCRKMLSDLRAWESRPLAERLALLIVSSGSVDDNRALGLRSPVLLDQESSVAKQYGLPGTPSAALVNASGYLVDNVIGASSILGLIGQPESGAMTPIVSRLPEPSTASPAQSLDTAAALLPPGARPLKHECVQDELLSDGSIVLYNSCRRQVLTLNATGALVWECCDGTFQIEEIAAEVREVFPAAVNAEQDVRQIIDSLLHASMIAPAVLTTDRESALTAGA